MANNSYGKYEKNYTKEIQEIIDKTILNEEQTTILKKSLLLIGEKSCIYNVFEDMYKLYIAEFSSTDIAKIYNKCSRSIEYIFKKCGISRTLKEAQKIATKKRDYNKIREKAKETALKRQANNIVFGSNIEQYVRARLAIDLNKKIKEINGECIVGMNTVTVAGELDIPIIILHENNFYKFGIEVNGTYYHRNKEKDKKKIQNFKELNYYVYELFTKAYAKEDNSIKYKNELDTEIDNIIKQIVKKVEQNIIK